MNKLLIITAFILLAASQKSFAQDSAKQSQTPQLLSLYYNIKDALVAGDANAASNSAQEFVKEANSADASVLPQSSVAELVKHAGGIADTKNITHQREHFAELSSSMANVVKVVKLTDQPVYQVYCPMKKAYWLSSSKTIKNPYFGSAMLNCGKVAATF